MLSSIRNLHILTPEAIIQSLRRSYRGVRGRSFVIAVVALVGGEILTSCSLAWTLAR
jgi:hypothetical protein